jgi:hypothetical protein
LLLLLLLLLLLQRRRPAEFCRLLAGFGTPQRKTERERNRDQDGE